MEDRLIGPDVAGAHEAIAAFEQWIGRAWLENRSPSHRLRELWRRLDVVSSLEMAILGKSLQRLQATQPPARLSEVAKTFKQNDLGNQIGAAYELTTAALLTVPGQAVRLLGPQQPAYDIEVDAGGRTLRFSCKALLPANVEREFDQFFARTEATVRSLASAGPLEVVCALWSQGAGAEHLSDELPFREMHARWLEDERPEFKIGAWWFGFSRLSSEHDALAFSMRYPSYSLMLAAELSGNEERRISDKIEEARRKFRAKKVVSDANAVNAVVLRLPPSINLSAAVAAVNASWGEHDTDLAGVLVTRLQVVSSDDFSESYPGFQWQWVPNPFAAYPLLEGAFRCELPIGQPLEATDIAYFIVVGGERQRVQRGFVRNSGRHNYEIRDPLSRKGQTFTTRHSPGIETFLVLSDRRRESLNLPPTDRFLFL